MAIAAHYNTTERVHSQPSSQLTLVQDRKRSVTPRKRDALDFSEPEGLTRKSYNAPVNVNKYSDISERKTVNVFNNPGDAPAVSADYSVGRVTGPTYDAQYRAPEPTANFGGINAQVTTSRIDMPQGGVNVHGPRVDAPNYSMNVGAPNIDGNYGARAPNADWRAPSADAQFGARAPNVDWRAPSADANLNARGPNMDWKGPNADVRGPNMDWKAPNADVNLSGRGPNMDWKAPNGDVNLGARAPNIDARPPNADMNIGGRAPGLDWKTPNADANISGRAPTLDTTFSTRPPTVDMRGPSVNAQAPHVDYQTPKYGWQANSDVNVQGPSINGPRVGMDSGLNVSAPAANVGFSQTDVKVRKTVTFESDVHVNGQRPNGSIGVGRSGRQSAKSEVVFPWLATHGGPRADIDKEDDDNNMCGLKAASNRRRTVNSRQIEDEGCTLV